MMSLSKNKTTTTKTTKWDTEDPMYQKLDSSHSLNGRVDSEHLSLSYLSVTRKPETRAKVRLWGKVRLEEVWPVWLE